MKQKIEIKEKNMEELIKLENFKFEYKAITATFEKFYFEVKGDFSEKELEDVKNEILFLIVDEGIYFDNVLRALFYLKELEDVKYITFKNKEMEEDEILYSRVFNVVSQFKNYKAIRKIEVIKSNGVDCLQIVPENKTFKLSYKNFSSVFSFEKEESIKISYEKVEIIEIMLEEYKDMKEVILESF